MLLRNGRNHRKTLKALTDPQPEFVSLVFGGANKTPFRAMRADGATISETTGMTEEQAIKAETHGIAKVEFDGEKFADEDACRAWLVDGGYAQDLPIRKTDGGFMVDSQLDPDAVLSVIDLRDEVGVTIHAVALKCDADAVLELTEKADKQVHPGATDEMRQRYGECAGLLPLTEYDDMPPGVLDLTMALYEAVRVCLKNADNPGATAAIGGFTSMLEALTRLGPDKDAESYKAFIDAIAPEIEMSKDETKTEAVEAVKTDETAEVTEAVEAVVETTEETAEKTDETAEAVAETVETAATEETTEAVVETAEKADEIQAETEETVEAATDPLTQLTAVVSELAATIKSMQETASGEMDKVVQRVAAIEDVRQTRKGADVDETSTGSQEKPTVSEDVDNLRRRSMLGMRPVSKN